MKITKKIFVAECVEAGDRFISLFQTNETDKQKLYDIGCELAADWGGECISVKAFRPKVTKKARLLDVIKNETVEVTERQYKNWIKKYPTSKRYDYSKTEFFEEADEIPEDVWDADLSTEENLAEIN